MYHIVKIVKTQNKNTALFTIKAFTLINLLLILIILLLLKDPSNYKMQNPKEGKGNQSSFILKLTETINQKCTGANNKESCFADELEILTKNSNLEIATKTLLQLQKVDPVTKACHFMAHKISIAETQKNPSQWKELIGRIDPIMCTSGFVHGIIEAHTNYDPSFDINKNTLEETCKYFEAKSTFSLDLACTHIMGHLLLSQNNANISQSINICGELIDKLQYECFSGVFMENMTRDNLVVHGIAQKIHWDTENTHKQEVICRQFSGKVGDACWREISHMFSATVFDDPKKVYNLCQKAPSLQSAQDCYLHASAIMPLSNSFNNANFKLLCQPYNQNSQQLINCLNIVVNTMMLSSLEMTKNTAIFCDSFNEKYRKTCYLKLENHIRKAKSAQEKEKLCLNVPENYRSLCLKTNQP